MDFLILGPLEVHAGDREITIGGAKQRALLALLLLHANERLSTDRLIDDLWGEYPPASAAKAVQMHVARLRKALEVSGTPSPATVLTRDHGYELSVDPENIDARRFERLLSEGRREQEASRPERAAAALEAALALWRGAPLADLTDAPFLRLESARLSDLRVVAVEELVEAKLALGAHAEVVGELEALIAEHPYRERPRAQLMLALYRCDRQADALQAYQDARVKLVEDLGIEPGERLRELERAVLEQDPGLVISADRRAAIEPTAQVQPTAFVGRERELSELIAALEGAYAGRGRLILLCGEPGIGKSRLAEEMVAEAQTRGACVVVGRCWEAGGAPAFWPWVQSLRAYVRETETGALRSELAAGATDLAQILPELRERLPDLAELPTLDSEGARFRLFEATAEFLRNASKSRPIVLVLDDLHAADEPSLLLLRFVARELVSTRVLIVGAYRDVDPIPGEPLTELIAEVAREPLSRRVTLAGLSQNEVEQYVQVMASEIASTELVAMLHGETEGNPLFVSETVRLLSLEGEPLEPGAPIRLTIPQTVRDVISRRLARLSPDCRQLLAEASVLGREFELDTLALLARDPRDPLLDTLDEALVARVVSEVPAAPGRLRFAHVLIRDTLYDGLTIGRRAKLHRRAGDALKRRYGDRAGAHLAELAHHALAGSDFADARTYATRAGDWALALLAYEEAVRLYTTALEALERAAPQDERGRCALLLSLGEAQMRAGNTPAAQSTFLEAAELARRVGLGRELARAAAGYGGRIVWARAGKDARVVPLLESGLAALADEDVELRVRLLARLAGALRDEASTKRRDALTREALELARRTHDPAVLACALDARGSVIGGRPETIAEQFVLASDLLEIAERTGDHERAVSAHYQKFIASICAGDVSGAERALTAATRGAEELRQPAHLWQVRAAWAMLALAAGRLAEAEQLVEEALATGRRAQQGIAIPTHTLHCYTLGDFQGRLTDIEPAVRAAATDYPSQPIYRCALVQLQAQLGQTADAQRALDELARNDFCALPADNEWLYGMSLLAEACSLLHDTTSAPVLYRLLTPYPEYNVVDTPDAIRGSVSRYLGLLAATLSRWDDATKHFEDALAMNARMGFLPWLAHTQRDYARILLSRDGSGDRERALEVTGDARAIYTTLGMDSWLERELEIEQTPRLNWPAAQ